MGTSGKRSRRARTPFMPSAMMSGVPASSQSTPARRAISAVDRASEMVVRSREICTIGFMFVSIGWVSGAGKWLEACCSMTNDEIRMTN